MKFSMTGQKKLPLNTVDHMDKFDYIVYMFSL
jgi:hypothetical protein